MTTALPPYTWILFIWIISMTNGADPPLDCNYVTFPRYCANVTSREDCPTMGIAIPIDVCVGQMLDDPSEYSSLKYVCDNNEVFMIGWRGASTCNDSITPSLYTAVSSSDFKCDATASCDYVEVEIWPFDPTSETCTDGVIGVAPLDEPRDIYALITDTCFSQSSSNSFFFSDCDSSGNVVYTVYPEPYCAGTPFPIIMSSIGTCNAVMKVFARNTACSVSPKTSSPSGPPTVPPITSSPSGSPTMHTGSPAGYPTVSPVTSSPTGSPVAVVIRTSRELDSHESKGSRCSVKGKMMILLCIATFIFSK